MTEPQPVDVKRILFVDDDLHLLEGLRDALRPFRRQWAMSFVTSGDEALSLLAEQEQDVVISDLRMPGMDGATLLARVLESHPTAVRIVLSGQAELRTVARAAGVAHRLLAKPCEIDELTRVIERSCALQDITDRVELNRRIAGASVVPSVPRLYMQLTELLLSGEGSASDAARIVEGDIAMAAKVLQLANSAYFGRRNSVTGVRDAVAYLGLEALRALALSAEIFRAFAVDPPIPGFDLEVLQRHSTRVAQLARAICEQPSERDEAFAAGLLHDVGLLVFASQERDELAATFAAARLEHRPRYEVERERHGVTHADVGAHLLALWGLPHTITDAVAHHHEPPPPGAPFDAVATTYVANLLIDQIESHSVSDWSPPSRLDDGDLEAAGMGEHLERWRELAARQVEGSQ
jgi:putative nucleotidyltransferase with HDIG domain